MATEHESIVSFISQGTRTVVYLSTLFKKLSPSQIDAIVIDLLSTGVDPVLIVSSEILLLRHLPLFLRHSRIDVFKEWVEMRMPISRIISRTDRVKIDEDIATSITIVIPEMVNHLRKISLPTFDRWPGKKDPLILDIGFRPLPYPYDCLTDELAPFVSAVSEIQQFMELWYTFFGIRRTDDFLKEIAKLCMLHAEDLHPLTSHALYSIIQPSLEFFRLAPSMAKYKAWGRSLVEKCQSCHT